MVARIERVPGLPVQSDPVTRAATGDLAAPAGLFEAILDSYRSVHEADGAPSTEAMARLMATAVRQGIDVRLLLSAIGTGLTLPNLEMPSQVPAAVPAAAPAANVNMARLDPQARFAALKPHFVQAERETGVPWQIQAAQWALESGWGRFTPRDIQTGRESNNLFGVKGTGSAGSVTSLTTEVIGGRQVAQTARFAAYSSPLESVVEHARLLTGPYYRPAHAAGKDLKAWADWLGPQKLGYATDPEYSAKLWNIIRENGWDKE